MYRLEILKKMRPQLVHGFSTLESGNQGYGFDAPGWGVIGNRAQFLREVHVFPREFPFQRTVGMTPLQRGFEENIQVIGPGDAGRGMGQSKESIGKLPCEAMVTNSCDLLLYLAVADCIPVILFDPRKCVLALVHAGRASTIRKIPAKTLRVMKNTFGTDPADVVVGMGPGLHSHILERLPPEISGDPSWWANCYREGEGFLVDLYGYNRDCLMTAGVPEEQIEVSPIDTFEDYGFYSHRRSLLFGDPEGRHAVAVGMVSDT